MEVQPQSPPLLPHGFEVGPNSPNLKDSHRCVGGKDHLYCQLYVQFHFGHRNFGSKKSVDETEVRERNRRPSTPVRVSISLLPLYTPPHDMGVREVP